jgi:hypothetical protein
MTNLLKQDSKYVSLIKTIIKVSLIQISNRSLTYVSLSLEITLLKAQNTVWLVESVHMTVL